jgi:FkbM family methyltransferase
MTELATTDWGLTYRPGSADRWILRESAYNRLLATITPEDRVLDAGGYIGSFSARARQRGATVLAYEPSPANFAICEINARAFGFDVVNAALTSELEFAPVQQPQYVVFYDAPDERRAPYASLLPKRGYTSRLVSAAPINRVQDTFQPTIVKLDVEGAEVELLRSLRIGKLRGLAIEWELQRNREECVALDELLDDIGLKRTGKPLARCTGRAVVKTYLRS